MEMRWIDERLGFGKRREGDEGRTAVEVLGELRGHAGRLEDTEDLVTGDEADLSDGGRACERAREQETLRVWDSGGDVSERMADPPVSGTQLTPGGSSKPPALKSI